MSTSPTDTSEVSLAEAFTREHHQIDAAIDEFLTSTEPDPHRRAVPLLNAVEALRRHIYLEEDIVFPHLPPGPLLMPLLVMRREHGELWRRMDDLERSIAAPSTSGGDLDEACRELLALLENHNAKEEPIIYPHMDTDLDAGERGRVRELFNSGTLPDGWVCQDA
ncbi:hemerythrin domain-containing protein [Tessaracoccus sp. HDW20]|uniref:hemerythrin domain-containing protein n=1 Tax=Tessaracoccus coleopterorum TaxID=2714950 RepID=UPI0018D44722|nr:hemerythrin domain-containing protein [Tessaracoccus coleopterorum]NHB85506.1 hemerythrin domain-containing protein [Tessaracoccus coleopterorum]